jgi:CheY-like chemotaxis protein
MKLKDIEGGTIMQGDVKILVVDKGPELIEVAREASGTYGWGVVIASEREDAMRKALVEEPDLIVLGYLEPQGEAFRLNRELKQNPDTRDIPIVIVDVNPEERAAKGWQKHAGMRMDAEDYLCQPVSPLELARSVEEILVNTGVLDVV